VGPVTRHPIESIMLDEWPDATAIADFGIDSQEPYEALYYPVRRHQIMPEILDRAPGKPPTTLKQGVSWNARLGPRQLSLPGAFFVFGASLVQLLHGDCPKSKSGRQDLNLRPLDPQSSALARLRHAPIGVLDKPSQPPGSRRTDERNGEYRR
jgi:hypothetical protein